MSKSLSGRIAFRAALLLALSSAALAQTTWYVDVNAPPPGQGTAGNPFASIQYAIDRPTTVAGDIVLVAPGTYFESLFIIKSITVKSSSGPLHTTLRPSGTFDGVELSGATYNTVLEGFTVSANTIMSGIYVDYGTVRRCIVRDCTSNSGIECPNGLIESCTIVRNSQGFFGGLGGSFVIRNSIVWGNPLGNFGPGGAIYTANYDAGIGITGIGCIPGDPGLWNLAAGDLRLRPGSPCIDAGDPASPLDQYGSRIDIGALTFDPSYAPGPSTYCVGKLNSQGCTPSIAATGTASATSSAPFTITAANEVDNKVGMLLFSFDKQAQAFQGGVLCISSPIKRVGVQNSGGSGACGGTFAFDMRAYIQSGVHPLLVPGALVYAQWWGRDPLDPAGFGSGLSDALYFGIAP